MSPVMWVNGANLPIIEWGRPIDADEALAFHRLGTESLLVSEGGRDVLQEAPDSNAASTATAWVRGAPMWVTCKDLHLIDRRLEVIRRLRNLVTSENKTVLVIHFRSVIHRFLLDAVSDGFRNIELRAYPKPKNEAGDFLASLFEAFRGGENQRRKAWIELLKRQDMVVAIIAEGGLPPSEELRDATAAAAALLVFSTRLAEDHEGSAAFWEGWQADDFDVDGTVLLIENEAVTAFLAAFALLDKPLSENAAVELACDFDLDFDPILRDKYLARFGQRYVIKASVARNAIEALSPSERRAAHRACEALLGRVRDEFDAPTSRQLVWRVHHCLQAEESDQALTLASRAIQMLAAVGNEVAVVQLFQSLGAVRRRLPAPTCMDVAAALSNTGNPKRAYDLLRQIPGISSFPIADRLRFAVLNSEALRNLPDDDSRKESIAVLEAVIKENIGTTPMTKDAKRWMLIAEHDLARNIHYFQRDTLRACEIFRRVISTCGTDPSLAYLKSAALRNLADALDRYTYDKVQRDPDSAEQCLRDAAEIASTSPSAYSLLPEMLLTLAKYEHSKRPGEAGRDIRRAIDLAREYGVGLVLTIAKDKLFWWQVGPLSTDGPPSAFDFREWTRLENELDLLVGHPWPVRVLIDSRLRGGKSLELLGRRLEAAEVLGRARSLLLQSPVLDFEGDWIHRWLPVFAGLAVLSQAVGDSTGASDMDMWAGLRAAALEAGLHWEIGEKTAKQVWEEVH